MAQYDGSIRINTKIETKESSSQLMSLENRIVKTADKIALLRSKMDALKDVEIPTEEYKEVQNQISAAEKKLSDLIAKQEKFLETGGKESSSTYKKMQYDIDEIRNSLPYLKGELQDLVDTGKAFTLGSGTEEYAKLGKQLEYAENDLELLNRRHDELINKQNKTSKGYKKLGDTAKKSFDKVNKSVKKTNGFLGTMASRFKGLMLSLLIFNQISKAFNAMISGIKEGMQNLAQYSNDTNEALSLLMSRSTYLKNALATAFSPIVEIATPILVRFIELLGQAATKVSEFFAALTGKDTFTRALKVQQNYADSLKKTASNTKEAAKETKKALAPFDDLRQIQFQEETGQDGDAGAGAELTPDQMFETDKVSDNMQSLADSLKAIGASMGEIFEKVKDKAQQLKDIFAQGFFDGLGDWEYRWESIKNSISSIKDSLINIWTDPAVLSAADGWLNSVVYMLGTLVGATASIGLTIATNIIGGISKYLEQNVDRIKQYLISMFSIWAEVNNMFAQLFRSLAYVFEAFASEQGQQLTANIIGIFADAFMGVTELASKVFRDLAQIVIQPFVDNQEAFRSALEGFLGILAEVTGTIKQGIDETFDKLNEVYDAHFKPFFDSVSQGISDLVDKFLEFWNVHVQPILEKWAQKFDELWKSHIQPLLNNASEFLGKIADLLKALWENILQPLISWIITNVLPKIMPVIDAIWTAVEHFVANLADKFNSIITILGGVVDFITGIFTGDWDKAFSGLNDIFDGFVDSILSDINMFKDLAFDLFGVAWENIKSSFEIGVDAITGILNTFFTWFRDNVTNKTTEIKQAFDNFLSRLKETWNEAWSSLGDIIGSVMDSIKSAVQSVFDWIIEKIDDIKQKIRDLKNLFKDSDELTYKSGSSRGQISRRMSYTPEIAMLSEIPYTVPALATGTVVPPNREFLASLGDNKREPEVVSPLSTMKQAFMEAMQESGISLGGGQTGPVYLQLDGKTFARLIGPYTEAEKTRVGVRMVTGNA